jgi:biopolymer transport protein ExbD/biopolymer transport protein TolR
VPKVQAAGEAAPARGGRPRRVSTSLAEINVVPLVDVMLVLLIIFMVTAPMIQRGVDVKLPVARRAAQQIQGERVYVTVPATYRQNHLVYLGDEAIRLDILQERVRQKVENMSEKQVYLRGDASVTYQELMEVFDRLKAAGVVNVGLVTRGEGER